jgi:hypothetical protein
VRGALVIQARQGIRQEAAAPRYAAACCCISAVSLSLPTPVQSLPLLY